MAATDTPYIDFFSKNRQDRCAKKLRNLSANDRAKVSEQVPDTFCGKCFFQFCRLPKSDSKSRIEESNPMNMF